MISTKIIYGFKIKKSLNMLDNSITPIESIISKVFIISKTLNRFNEALRNFIIFIINIRMFIIDYRFIHMNVKDVINFASMRIKNYYNKYYQFIFFNVENLVKLRFYRKYELFKVSIKLNQ